MILVRSCASRVKYSTRRMTFDGSTMILSHPVSFTASLPAAPSGPPPVFQPAHSKQNKPGQYYTDSTRLVRGVQHNACAQNYHQTAEETLSLAREGRRVHRRSSCRKADETFRARDTAVRLVETAMKTRLAIKTKWEEEHNRWFVATLRKEARLSST